MVSLAGLWRVSSSRCDSSGRNRGKSCNVTERVRSPDEYKSKFGSSCPRSCNLLGVALHCCACGPRSPTASPQGRAAQRDPPRRAPHLKMPLQCTRCSALPATPRDATATRRSATASTKSSYQAFFLLIPSRSTCGDGPPWQFHPTNRASAIRTTARVRGRFGRAKGEGF